MQQYKIDIFNLLLKPVFFSPLSDCTISVDYQQLTTSEFVPIYNLTNEVKLRYFVRVSDFYNNKTIYEGYITTIANKDNKTILTCQSLYGLLDYQIWYDRTNFSNKDLETNIENLLALQYATKDKFKQISYKVVKQSSTQTQMFNLKDNIFNVFTDVVAKAFNIYGFIVRVALNIDEQKVVFSLTILSDKEKVIETSNTDITGIDINENSTQSAPNIITLIDKKSSNENGQWSYYLTKDGGLETTSNASNRIYPPIHIYEYFEYTGDDYFGDILNYTKSIARDKLIPKKYNHYIEIYILQTSKLIDISEIKIGDKFKIYITNTIIDSVLTGYEIENDHTIKLVFGNLRMSLTDILKERLN